MRTVLHRVVPRSMSRVRSASVLLAVGVAMSVSACAARVAPTPPVVGTPRYPNFLFPSVPDEYAASPGAATHQRAWLFLQAGDLREARRGFTTVLQAQRDFFPAEVGLAYVDLADRDVDEAIAKFGRTIGERPSYVPALIGRGEALLVAGRDGDALESFEAALTIDASLTAVQRRIDVLRFRGLQAFVDAGRRAASAGAIDEARRQYERALSASPESGFLHRELAALERDAGALPTARTHAREATTLDPADAAAFVLTGEIEEALGAYDAAVDAYRRAADLEPSESLDEKLARATALADYARLPDEYRAITASPVISRGALAALIGVRLRGLLDDAARGGAELVTDVRDHWAAAWILAVANAGVMEVYPNHTFQPAAGVRRGELARAVSQLLNQIARRNAAIAQRWTGALVSFRDLSSNHLLYPDASRSVAAGILSSLPGERFGLSDTVSGADAVVAVERVEALAAESRGRRP